MAFPGYEPNEQQPGTQTAAQRAFDQDHVERHAGGDPNLPRPHTEPVQPQPARADAPAKPKTPKEVWDFAKKQAEERRALTKKHAESRRGTRKAKSSGEPAEPEPASAVAAREAQEEKEKTELAEKQAKDRAQFDRGQTNLPVFNGMAIQDAVEALHADLTALAAEHNIEVGEIHTFGLEFDVFDPVTGMVTSPAHAHRRDIGVAGALMTAEAVISDIESARRHQATAGVTQYAVDRIM